MSNVSRFLAKFYAFKFLNTCVFLYPVMAVMFGANGVSDVGIGALMAIWAAFVMLLHPIIGYWGDTFSRKHILIVGQLAKCACFVVFALVPNFWGYVVGFLLWAIQWGIEASVADAFLYDELRTLGARKHYQVAAGRSLACYNAGMLVSCAGAFLAQRYGFDFVLGLSAVCMLMATLCVMAIPMRQPKSYARTKNRILLDLKNSARFILKNRMLWILVLVFACVTSLSEQDDFTGLLGLELGVSMGAIGIMFAVSRVAEICGAMAAHWIAGGRQSVTYGVVVLTGALFAAIMFSGVRTIWPILFMGYFTYAIARVRLNTAIQNMIPSARRSMVLSFTDILCQIMLILFYGLITLGAVLGGYKTGFMILGVCVMVVGMGALAVTRQHSG